MLKPTSRLRAITVLSCTLIGLSGPTHAQSAEPTRDAGYAKYAAQVEAIDANHRQRFGAQAIPVKAMTFEEMIQAKRVPGMLLVRFASESPSDDLFAELGIIPRKELSLVPGLYLVEAAQGDLSLELLERLNARTEVRYAEPDLIGEGATTIPDDPNIDGTEWWLTQVRAFDAWDIATDATAIGPIAVFDTGIEVHEDLRENMWENPGEIPGNGIDDDSNGYIDDVNGIEPYDGTTGCHGTPVAGTIAARGNNATGYVGSAWSAELMNITGVWQWQESAFVEGMAYARDMGSRISNHSWGISSFSVALADTVDQMEVAGHLLVVAAHNFNRDIDIQPVYPASLPNTNIITIAASTQSETRISYSNWGIVSVDLAAPTEFTVAQCGGGYGLFSGTSQSTPVVTGAVALAWAQVPGWTHEEIRQHVFDNVRPSSNWTSLVSTGGILDMSMTMENLDIDDMPFTRFCEAESVPSPNTGLKTRMLLESQDAGGGLIPFENSIAGNAAPNRLMMIAKDAPGTGNGGVANIGYFVMGTGQNTFVPSHSMGPLCVAPGIKRFLGPVNSTTETIVFHDAGGTPMTLIGQGFSRAALGAGAHFIGAHIGGVDGFHWSFQAWHRDGGGDSNLSDAVGVDFLP